MLLCTPIPTVFYLGFLTWGSHVVILSKLGTQKGDPLEGMLCALTHFHVLCLIVIAHPTCVFLGMHIVGPALDVVLFFYNYKRNFQH